MSGATCTQVLAGSWINRASYGLVMENMALNLHLLQSGRENLAAEVLQLEQTGLLGLD